MEKKLRALEAKWRSRKTGGTPSRVSPWIRAAHNVQYFACNVGYPADDLPVVVEIGINYTQDRNKIPDQIAPASAPRPSVADQVKIDFEKDCINHCIEHRAAWDASCLVGQATNFKRLLAPEGPEGTGQGKIRTGNFHLVMTNLSPWITKYSWNTSLPAPVGAELLVHPPHSASAPCATPFGHLDDLFAVLGNEVFLWIGHGLDSVPDHFRMFLAKHRIADWILIANTASGCRPYLAGTEVKFARKKAGEAGIKE